MNRESYGLLKSCRAAIALLLAMAFIAAWIQPCALGQSAAPLRDPIKIDSGYVAGTIIGDVGKQVRVYRGIPYAAPPVGDLRWKPPQPVTPWKGIREATQFTPWAPQHYPTMRWFGSIQESQMSEDCLYLNVLTPAKTAADKLPVMVWIHPGGLDAGSGNQPQYNGASLPRHGVVLVNVMHRIGAMGFYVHPGLVAESPHHAAGNYGLLDIVASLEWVKKNIAAFGGDPSRVTVFGQSGGAAQIVLLLAVPQAKGLFQGAIIESGGGVSPQVGGGGAPSGAPSGAPGGASGGAPGAAPGGAPPGGGGGGGLTTLEDAEQQGVKIATALGAHNIAEMRAKPWQEIVNLLPPPPQNSPYKLSAVIDGWSIPDNPYNIYVKDLRSDVPVMIGGGEGETMAKGFQTMGDALLKGKSNTYVYVFSHLPSNWKKAGLVSYHGEELSYEFGALDAVKRDWNTLVPASSPQDPGIDQDDETVADNIMRMWVQFAKTGDPSVPGLIKCEPIKAGPGGDNYIDIGLKPQMKSGYYTHDFPRAVRGPES